MLLLMYIKQYTTRERERKRHLIEDKTVQTHPGYSSTRETSADNCRLLCAAAVPAARMPSLWGKKDNPRTRARLVMVVFLAFVMLIW